MQGLFLPSPPVPQQEAPVLASRRATTPIPAKVLPAPPQENLGSPGSGKILLKSTTAHPTPVQGLEFGVVELGLGVWG